MIGQFAKRPESRHKSNLRPVTGRATQESMKQSNQCFEIAKKHMIKKQYDQALKHYTNATIHNPGNYKALCNMGRIYKQTNKFNQARFCYHKALFANSNDPITLYNLANLQRICGNDEIAIQLYKKVINLKQTQNVDVGSLYFDSYINQGICYKNLQFYDEAVACNDKAIHISPNDQSCHFNKAMCILKKIYTLLRTNFVTVKKQLCTNNQVNFKKVLEINPNNFTAKVALIQLGYLADPTEDKLKKAVEELEKLEKIAGENDKYELGLKIKYCKNQLKKIDEAKIILQPKKDIVERVQTANKYDDTKKKQDQQKSTKPQQKPKQPQKQKQKPQIPSMKPKQQNKLLSSQPVSNEKRTMISNLLNAKKYSQAFNVAKDLPDSNQKYELQTIINYYQCVEEENQIYLESAIGIYTEYIMKNNQSTPITRDTCSEEGHQVMATMLTVYGNYAQASKHYQILLNLVQDKKFQKNQQKQNDDKLRQIHVQLGICYAERGLIQQAISQYKKSLEMQPDNYFLMTNLCGLLIQDNKKEEARKYYEKYLVKNGGEEMEDKASYVDSLLNISICVRDTPEEQAALQKTIQAVEKFFPTMENIKASLNQEAILGLYLRQVQLLQDKSEKSKPGSLQRKQIGQKMLQANLTCLNFDNCPDRQAICVNTGILFYLSGCYANALSFYRAVVFSKKVIANNIALALLQMSQYQRGSSWLQLAIQQNPDNIIYATNLQIVKWICGIQDRKQITKYECKCQTMYQTRAQLGLHLINQLTTMIDQNQVKIITAEGGQAREEAERLFGVVMDRCYNSGNLANRNQIWKIKSKVIYNKLDQHMKEVHMKQPGSSKISVPTNILDIALKKSPTPKQLQQTINHLIDYINSLNPTSPQYDIIQNLLYLQILTNAQLPDKCNFYCNNFYLCNLSRSIYSNLYCFFLYYSYLYLCCFYLRYLYFAYFYYFYFYFCILILYFLYSYFTFYCYFLYRYFYLYCYFFAYYFYFCSRFFISATLFKWPRARFTLFITYYRSLFLSRSFGFGFSYESRLKFYEGFIFLYPC